MSHRKLATGRRGISTLPMWCEAPHARPGVVEHEEEPKNRIFSFCMVCRLVLTLWWRSGLRGLEQALRERSDDFWRGSDVLPPHLGTQVDAREILRVPNFGLFGALISTKNSDNASR